MLTRRLILSGPPMAWRPGWSAGGREQGLVSWSRQPAGLETLLRTSLRPMWYNKQVISPFEVPAEYSVPATRPTPKWGEKMRHFGLSLEISGAAAHARHRRHPRCWAYVRRGPVHDMGAAAGTATVVLRITWAEEVRHTTWHTILKPPSVLFSYACMVGE
jgi:hypothetical protein